MEFDLGAWVKGDDGIALALAFELHKNAAGNHVIQRARRQHQIGGGHALAGQQVIGILQALRQTALCGARQRPFRALHHAAVADAAFTRKRNIEARANQRV